MDMTTNGRRQLVAGPNKPASNCKATATIHEHEHYEPPLHVPLQRQWCCQGCGPLHGWHVLCGAILVKLPRQPRCRIQQPCALHNAATVPVLSHEASILLICVYRAVYTNTPARLMLCPTWPPPMPPPMAI